MGSVGFTNRLIFIKLVILKMTSLKVDCVCRDMLMYKLLVMEINGKMYFILKLLYTPVDTTNPVH